MNTDVHTTDIQTNDSSAFESGEAAENKSKYDFLRFDRLFAVIAFALGYVYAEYGFLISSGFAPASFWLGFTLMLFAYASVTKTKISASGYSTLALAAVFSIGFVFCSSPLPALCCTLAAFACIMYSMLTVNGKNNDFLGGRITFDMLKSVFSIPFAALGAVWYALFERRKTGKRSALAGKIILGLLLAIIPTAMVLILLRSADAAFSSMTDSLFDINVGDAFDFVGSFILGIPVAMYVFASVWGSKHRPKDELYDDEHCDRITNRTRIIPSVTVYTAVIPLIIVYVLFFVSQSAYFLSALSNLLPENYTYAEYARSGFFELCGVAVINFIIICAVTLFTKKETEKEPALARILKGIICIFTEVLIAIDIAKMSMYIREYGLTQKRVYTTLFMILLAVIFLAVLAKQLLGKIKITAFCVVSVLVFCGIMVFGRTDAFIAKYNVNAYISGAHEGIDIAYLMELDETADEYIVKLLDYDGIDRDMLLKNLNLRKRDYERNGTAYSTVYTAKSVKLIEEAERKWGDPYQ